MTPRQAYEERNRPARLARKKRWIRENRVKHRANVRAYKARKKIDPFALLTCVRFG